jgi:hypothetical protein
MTRLREGLGGDLIEAELLTCVNIRELWVPPFSTTSGEVDLSEGNNMAEFQGSCQRLEWKHNSLVTLASNTSGEQISNAAAH